MRCSRDFTENNYIVLTKFDKSLNKNIKIIYIQNKLTLKILLLVTSIIPCLFSNRGIKTSSTGVLCDNPTTSTTTSSSTTDVPNTDTSYPTIHDLFNSFCISTTHAFTSNYHN
jgi:hypothetical protein